ncbi:MAG: hypothetical protein ACM3SY_20550 [Candidatus Omnitrophota bacterium]
MNRMGAYTWVRPYGTIPNDPSRTNTTNCGYFSVGADPRVCPCVYLSFFKKVGGNFFLIPPENNNRCFSLPFPKNNQLRHSSHWQLNCL